MKTTKKIRWIRATRIKCFKVLLLNKIEKEDEIEKKADTGNKQAKYIKIVAKEKKS